MTCLECEDYDLCIPCHTGLKHGHHPGHTFIPVSDETILSTESSVLCAPGRNMRHEAICDGCDKACFFPTVVPIFTNLVLGYPRSSSQVYELPRLGLLFDLCQVCSPKSPWPPLRPDLRAYLKPPQTLTSPLWYQLRRASLQRQIETTLDCW